MATQMTKAEYEATYGVAPVFSKESLVDTTPAPIRMTRAEYNTRYRPSIEEKRGGFFDYYRQKAVVRFRMQDIGPHR